MSIYLLSAIVLAVLALGIIGLLWLSSAFFSGAQRYHRDYLDFDLDD